MPKQRTLFVNVKKDMSRSQIRADMERGFGMGLDVVGMCELETPWHHSEFRRCARKYGYQVYLPPTGAQRALGIAVKNTYGTIIYAKARFAAPGASGFSPHRYVNRVRIQLHDSRETVAFLVTHMWSSGWTGTRHMDALRKLRWYVGMKVVKYTARRATLFNDLVVLAGDFNRPPWAFTGGRVFPGVLDPRGMKTVGYAHTDHTHGGVTFDYVMYLSRDRKVECTYDATPAFNSDHDGIIATLVWS